MRRYKSIAWGLIVGTLLVVTLGCPSLGHFGRIILINESNGPIKNLAISSPYVSTTKSWPLTEKGQAWAERGLGHFVINVAWDDEKGEHHDARISFEKEAEKRSKQDLIVLISDGRVDWKLAGWRSHATGGGEEDKGATMFMLCFSAAWVTALALGALVAIVSIVRCKTKPQWELKLLASLLLLYVFFEMGVSAVARWDVLIR
jgi:hypothetical protein